MHIYICYFSDPYIYILLYNNSKFLVSFLKSHQKLINSQSKYFLFRFIMLFANKLQIKQPACTLWDGQIVSQGSLSVNLRSIIMDRSGWIAIPWLCPSLEPYALDVVIFMVTIFFNCKKSAQIVWNPCCRLFLRTCLFHRWSAVDQLSEYIGGSSRSDLAVILLFESYNFQQDNN